ncbi:hypothetical protein [Haloprofundus salilacus]|uniref:hypothetical protein n=1 Tax=Haloprofundus salilacus TaxID=2876190 RepID=UPI001CCDC9B9|nr:hypothetical protein [Haloprofundus salilacus]
MSSARSRRRILRLCGVAFGLGTAGCVQTTPVESVDKASNESTPTPEPTAIPASVVSDEEAEERALEAEGAYITEQLEDASCVTDWGTTATVTNKEATVTDRTADGVHVEVTHPYWYSSQQREGNETVVEEADGGTNARYVVTAADARRADGDTISVYC